MSFAGLLIRDASHGERPVRMGGIGGVKTHPDHPGLGHAAEAMNAAHRLFIEEGTVDFGLLVCNDTLIPYYGRLGWLLCEGEILTDQPEGKVKFNFNRVMTRSVAESAPSDGVIDLNGPPW